MENEDEFQKKQSLLQKEIIDKSFDKTAFINFCISKKDNGDDLNNWTYDELSEIVKEFVSSQKQVENEKEQEQKNEEEIKTENIEKLEKFNAEEHKNFKEKTINCKKLEKTQLNDNEVKVTVANPITVEGGMFSKSYIKYDVTTQPFNWTVERRYSDFDALRKLLQKYYPSFYVPPLPAKKIGNKRFTDSFIQKRMKFLNQFINNVCQIESFKASEILLSFLSYTDRGKFESKFKEFQTKTPSNYIEEYKTLDGIISISLDEKNEKYFKNINKYFSVQEKILDSTNYNLKALNHNLKVIEELIKVIQKNFEVLHVLNTRVMMKPTITKTYEEISCFFKNWGNILTKQRLIIKDHMKDFFKYLNLEGKAYSELIVRREDLKTKYNNESARIAAKKEKLFNAKDINKMEINTEDKELDKEKILSDKTYAFEHICFEETKNLERLNNQLGYANKMNMRELRKLIKEYIGRFIDNMMTFNQEFYPTINDLLNTWTNIETFVQTSNASVKR
jgi:hypothetical protein